MQPIITDFPQMIDLALGSPEFNVVNLNVLHVFLHGLVKTLNLNSSRVEIYGNQYERFESLIKTTPERSNININEYEMEKDDGASGTERVFVVRDDVEELQSNRNLDPKILTRKVDITLEKDFMKLYKETAKIDKLLYNTIAKSSKLESNIQTNANVISDVRDKIDDIEHLLISNVTVPPNYRRGQNRTEKADKKPTIDVDKQIYNDMDALRIQISNIFKCLQEYGEILKEADLMPNHVLNEITSRVNIPDAFIVPIRPRDSRVFEIVSVRSDETKQSNEHKRDDYKHKLFESKFVHMERQFDIVEKQFTEIGEKLIAMSENIPTSENRNEFLDMQIKIQEINEMLEKCKNQADSLETDKQFILNDLEKLRQKDEELAIVKIDRDDAEQQIQGKVDFEMLHKRVPFDVFDATKRELVHVIENFMKNVNDNVSFYEVYIKDLETNLEKKPGKDEISQFKRSVNTKILFQQAQINSIKKKQNEAAGTTMQYINDVKCISCNNEVIMRNEELSSVPAFKKSVSHHPVKQEKKSKIIGPTNQILNIDHPSKRFCGGEHTVISPEVRAKLKSNFVGHTHTESCPYYSVLLRGTDGTLFKSDQRFRKSADI